MTNRFLFAAGAIVIGATTVSMLGGCVSSEQAAEQIAVVDSPAGFNQEESNWERPFWEDGPEQETARPQPETASSDAANNATVRASMPVPEGVLLENLAVIGATSTAMTRLRELAPDYGFRLVPASDVRDALNRIPECDDAPTGPACTAGMAAYPGARVIVAFSDNNTASISDAASGAQWANLTLAASDAGEILAVAQDQSEIAPWAMRAFRADDGRLYLSLGRANGAKAGDELAIFSPGSLVRSPNGQPIAWRPGERVGTVRIGELFGSDLASLIPVEGQQLTDQHELLLIRE